MSAGAAQFLLTQRFNREAAAMKAPKNTNSGVSSLDNCFVYNMRFAVKPIFSHLICGSTICGLCNRALLWNPASCKNYLPNASMKSLDLLETIGDMATDRRSRVYSGKRAGQSGAIGCFGAAALAPAKELAERYFFTGFRHG